ncbi:TPA: hypothetical protein ACH3X2_001184 [Trebouxia sp. C0005]
MERGGAQPRNVEYYLQRMVGYSKNTIRILPQSKPTYNAGDTVIFRLPTNSILDLHTMNMKFSCQLSNVGTAAAQVSVPRFTQSFIRRFDITMGGMQTGLGALHDYGACYHLMAVNKIPTHRTKMDLRATDHAGYLTAVSDPTVQTIGNGANSSWIPLTISSWRGLAGGSFMRFLDTNLCPDIEIRIQLAPTTILPSSNASYFKYLLQNLSLSMESISFGDGSYRAMVDVRMSTGNPLVIPFYNWSGFEGNTTTQNVNQQFTIGTESLNGIIGTLRPQNYDSQVTATIGGFDSDGNGNRYVPQLGNDPTVGDKAATTGSGLLYSASTAPAGGAIVPYPTNSFVGWYHTFLSGEQPTNNTGGFGGQGTWTANYQFNIDSKLYPQFQADVHDAWHLMRNLFDANALSLTYGSSVQSLDQFAQQYFGFALGLDHHADDGGKDHLISGLNTTGSLIPITFSVNMTQDSLGWWGKLRTMCGGGFRPTIFCNMTSTLMIFRDRTISVVN